MKSSNWFTLSIFIYGLTWITMLALMAFVGELGGKTVSSPTASVQWPQALAINLLLLTLFGVQHSIMARQFFKRLMARAVPDFAYRIVFIMASMCALGLVIHSWQPIDTVLWQFEWRPLKLVLLTCFSLGALMIIYATVEIDHFHFFGVKQCFYASAGEAYREPEFRANGLYGIVRHPIHLGMLMLLWSAPTMTAGRLLFAAGMTTYVLIGLRLEERDLAKELGSLYSDYIARMPMLLPGLRPSFQNESETVDNGIFWGIDVPQISLRSGAVRLGLLFAVAMASAVFLEPFYGYGNDRPVVSPSPADRPTLVWTKSLRGSWNE